MRVCVVGCGAVGSLFAANLAALDDVEVWAYDLSRDHVDAINARRAAPLRCRRGRRPAARDHRRRRAAGVRLRDRGDEGDAHRRRDRRDRACVRGRRRSARCRTASATRRRCAEHVRARHPRYDVPGGPHPRAGSRAVGRQGRHHHRPVRAEPGSARGGRAARGRLHARGAADRLRSADARGAAVAQGDLQRRDEPGRRADRPDARPRLRATRRCGGSSRASSTRARRSPRRRGSPSTPTRRS